MATTAIRLTRAQRFRGHRRSGRQRRRRGRTAVDGGLTRAPGGRTVTLTGAVARPSIRDAAIPEGTSCCSTASRSARRAALRRARSDHARNMSNEVPVVRDLPADLSHRAARLLPGLAGGDVAGLPPAGWPCRHPQLRAHRADEHVREPRGAADRDARRAHALAAASSSRTSTASSRSRTTRAAAVPTARTSTSCCARCRTTPATRTSAA